MFSQFHGVRGIRNFALIGLIAVIALDFFGPCRRRKPAEPGKPSPVVPPLTLKPEETKKIQIDTNKREVTYAIRKPDGTVETKVVEGVRRATITETKDGVVTVTAKRWGFTFEPGAGVLISNGPRIAGDIQFFYFDRFGANAGIYYNGHLRLFLAGDYTLTRFKLFNSSLYAGVDLQKELIVGIRVRL